MTVSVVVVMSVDGKLTRHDESDIHKWVSDEDQEFFRPLLASHDVIIMGRNTYEAVQPNLRLDQPIRRIVLTSHPQQFTEQALLDIRKARSSPDLSNSAANGFSSFDVSTDTSSSDKTVFARVNSPLERTILRKSSIKDRLEFRNEKSTDLVKRLKREGIKKVLIVGGPRIISELLKGKLIDFLYLTIEPRLFGQGVLLLDSFPIDIELNLVEHKELNKKGTILLKYSLKQTQ